MSEALNETGYRQTKAKLAGLQRRLDAIIARQDMPESHKAAVVQSYQTMAAQYRREIKLFEARHPASTNA
jgi:hypothetical protein